ncbi:cytochrome b5 domain-containing protein [Aquimarina sp. RZ0]|uniref:cytochrome b5 domain-containing protein n=1 Tax=Aquimarina sp. RZ0 TaxID=2607730 RepID=UPI0011F14028|nr:cytochrome b5 domain-containing protein [Aquimarina sp. RZ0]KAA1245659.1 hypothetical protein F0000_11245 [Aquimarina sp. RZ0]
MKKQSLKVAPVSELHILVKNAEEQNQKLNHENLGFLSFSNGFMPQISLKTSLPKEFEVWDRIASQLPVLFKNQTMIEELQKLPNLSSKLNSLDDEYLLRSSSILSFLAHAFVRCSKNINIEVPSAIIDPWKIVTRRLSRPAPFMSYIDLIVYNYKLIDSRKSFTVENLDLLIPIIGNQEERVFYLVQTEILKKSTEIFQEVIKIHDAMLTEDDTAIDVSLQHIKKTIVKITNHIFPKINPNPNSSTYVNPIIWAKTVAPFAVPIHENIQGPSGTSSPLFHLLDTFLERPLYNSELGREALLIREWYPKNWRDFLSSVHKISFREYMHKRNNKQLKTAYLDVQNCYFGENGFLDIHKKKVYSYLQAAFKVGRSLTIGGFQGEFDKRAWEEVDDALIHSKSERSIPNINECPFFNNKVGKGQKYFLSQIATHTNAENGYWLILDKSVYDITKFLTKHPGGQVVIKMHVGLDATKEFKRVGHTVSSAVLSMIKKYKIGDFMMPVFLDKELQIAHKNWSNALSLCTEMLNAFILDTSINDKELILLQEQKEDMLSPLKQVLSLDLLVRFKKEYLESLFKIIEKCITTNLVSEDMILKVHTYKNDADNDETNNDRNFVSQKINKDEIFLNTLKNELIKGNQIYEQYHGMNPYEFELLHNDVEEKLIEIITDYLESQKQEITN